jgi:hypothetical protein
MLDFKAVCRVKRKGEPETVRQFSVRDAVVGKLWGKKGYNGKDTPWITNPRRMLQMRARGFALRDAFADVLKGMMVAEELIGTEADTVFDPAPPPPPPAPENLLPPPPPPPPVQPDSRMSDVSANMPKVEAELLAQARREAEQLQAQPKEEPRVVNEPVGEPEEEPVTMESLLVELDEKLGFQKTAEEIEEAYTNFDAEPLLSDYEGGVEAARNMKTRHLYRVGAGNVPLSERPSAEKPAEPAREENPADPADDFPGNSAIETARKAAEDPEAAMRAYKERLVAVLNNASTTDEVEKFWSDTAEEREALGAPEAVRLRWKAAKQQAVAAIRSGL